jgi:hypothetical protein
MKATPITTTKFANIFRYPSTKSQGTLAFHLGFLHNGNSSKNVKKKERNADKREVLQAHVAQVQSLENEFESLKAQLVNLKCKSF